MKRKNPIDLVPYSNRSRQKPRDDGGAEHTGITGNKTHTEMKEDSSSITITNKKGEQKLSFKIKWVNLTKPDYKTPLFIRALISPSSTDVVNLFDTILLTIA